MTWMKLTAPLGALALLAGCDLTIKDGEEAAGGNNFTASAEGKAEDGKISVKAPGLDFSFKVPKGIADNMKADADSEILYPGSSIRGIHAAQGAKAEDGVRQGEVEIRFASPDPADRIAAWYRDPARGEGFAVTSAVQEGAGYLLAGTTKREGDGFKLHLDPGGDGGTDGRLIVQDRN